jgi:hypothetical protein
MDDGSSTRAVKNSPPPICLRTIQGSGVDPLKMPFIRIENQNSASYAVQSNYC